MDPRSISETLTANPFVAAAILAVCGIIFLLALKDRRYVLFAYLFFLPMAHMPIFAGRLVGIPGVSVQNLLMGLGLYAIFLTRSRKTRMDQSLRRVLILYWIVVVAVVLHGMFYVDELTRFHIFENYGIYDFLRNYLFIPTLAWLSFVISYRYAAAGPGRASEYLRYVGIATIGYAILVLASVAYYFVRIRDYNMVRDLVFFFLGSHSNEYSFAFVMVAPILLAGAMSKWVVPWSDRILFWLALAGAGAAVLFSYSRSGYIGLALTAFGFAILVKRSLLLLLVPAVVGLVLFSPASVTDRVQYGFDSTGESTNSEDSLNWNRISAGRLGMADAAFGIITRDVGHILFGGGRLTFPRNTYLQFGVEHPHNAYLEALIDAGIVGVVFIVAPFLLLFLRAIKGMRQMRTSEFRLFYAAATVSLGSYLLLGLTGRSFFPELSLAFVWQVSGFALGLLRYDVARAQQQSQPSRIS